MQGFRVEANYSYTIHSDNLNLAPPSGSIILVLSEEEFEHLRLTFDEDYRHGKQTQEDTILDAKLYDAIRQI